MPINDPATLKNILIGAFNAGVIWGSVRAAMKRQTRQGKEITRLRQYKAWSHRALSVLISHHETNHPGQRIIDDWKEAEEGGETNGA